MQLVAVIGNGDAEPARDQLAEAVGRLIAQAGHGLVCGGLGGVMEAACRGAHGVLGAHSGRIIGLLPGAAKEAANPYVDVALPTGLGYARNVLVVLSADAIVAIGGNSGTLSEIAHAWQAGKPICAVGGAPGWAARLAGKGVDDRRADKIFAAPDVAAVGEWLAATLSAA